MVDMNGHEVPVGVRCLASFTTERGMLAWLHPLKRSVRRELFQVWDSKSPTPYKIYAHA